MRFFNIAGAATIAGTTFANVAALSAADMSGVASGTVFYTAHPRSAAWTLDTFLPGPSDGITTIDCATGGSFRRDVVRGSPGAGLRSWFISSAGDNEADGLYPETPIRDIEEFLCRLGHQPIDGGEVGTMFVNLMTDFNAVQRYTFDPKFVGNGGLAFVGTKTVLATGTIATVTPWDEANKVIGSYGLTGAPNLTSLGYVGKMIRVSSGPRVGLKATISYDLGSGTFQANWCDQSTGLVAEPVAGDAIEIYRPTRLGGDIMIAGSGGVSTSTGGGNIVFQDVELGIAGQSHTVSVSGTSQVLFISCIVHGCDVYEACPYVNMTACDSVELRSYSFVDLYGTTHTSVGGSAISARSAGVIHVSSRIFVTAGTISAGHPSEGPGTLNADAPIAVGNYAALDAFTVYPGSQAVLKHYAFANNSGGGGTAFKVHSGGTLFYLGGKIPAVSPSSGAGSPLQEFEIGGTPILISALPFFNGNNGACAAIFH